MKTRPVSSLLGFICLMLVCLGVKSQGKVPKECTLGDTITSGQVPFPDIEKWAEDSYQMTVEYTVPGVSHNNSYTEFYDMLSGRGRVDCLEDGNNLQYIYYQKTWEAWNIKGDKCKLQNITDIPDLLKDYQMGWTFVPDATRPQYITVGPSAMFKLAHQNWNSGQTGKKRSMAYLGELHGTIRGIRAQVWRWCQTPDMTVDYFFTANNTNNAHDPKSMRLRPLRVAFYDHSPFDADLSEQYHDIVNFQPYISPGIHPFQLPRGKNCQRGGTLNPPMMPDYSYKSILFAAEVLYRRVRTKGVDSFYSNIRLALDQQSQTLSYSYSPWNSTKDKGEVMTENIIYDIQYNYVYRTDYETNQCTISRDKKFIPSCRLPQDGEFISLTDPFILFPNNEFSYLTTGYDRGVEVDFFEVVVENYLLSESTIVNKAIITRSYLTDNEILKNNFEMKNALTQIELRLFRRKFEEEVLTFNFLSFSTKLHDKRRLFDITRCFQSDDDYSWVNLGFESAGAKYVDLSALPVSDVKQSILSYLDINLDVKPMRVPVVMVDTKKELLYISLLLLEKPSSLLDFTYMEDDKTITTNDVQRLTDLNTCATACLEQRKNCWGFAICGAECFYGTSPDSKITTQKGCILHKRFNNETYLKSKDSVIQDMQRQIKEASMKLTLDIGGTLITLKATHIDTADPA